MGENGEPLTEQEQREAIAKAAREKEVAASRASLNAVRSKGLEKQSIAEAELTYKQILTDLCKQCDIPFKGE